jgi:type VI secretion system protein ImpF
MSPAGGEPEFVLSVFDRLCDDAPESPAEDRPLWIGPRETVKRLVLNNLSWVLNARRYVGELPGGAHHLQRSVLGYGLPDFSGMTMETAADREALREAIESAVRRFEPRLSRVRVSPPQVETGGRDLRFQIDAVLQLWPAPEFVSFDSVLLLPVRAFELRG